MDDKLPHRTMLEVELVDAVIRLMDMAYHKVKGCSDNVLVSPVSGFMKFRPNMGDNLFRISQSVCRLYNNSEFRIFYSECIWAIIDLMDHLNLEFEKTFEEKMAYNATRSDHTREGRLAPGGKKY